ncbi:MAG TPA: hypothetical protein PLK99_13035, partial [Burkholderiales bacterium]|nr:hypothetical protein [Burkholderiales bacterium]
VPKKEQTHAVDVLNSFRTLSAALGITISDIAWDRITAHELNRLSSPDAGNAFRYAREFGNRPAFHLAHGKFVQAASLMTLNDFFHLLSLIFVGLAAAVWLLRPDARKDPDMIILENLGEEP